MMSRWRLSTSGDRAALAVVDGLGRFAEHGPHYSRRSPGSKTFTGIGQEIVLITRCGRAVWSCVRQRVPQPVGSGSSRGRVGESVPTRYIFRNNVFRNLGAGLSSELIREAVERTYTFWRWEHGELPTERLRTEIDTRFVKSTNPGYCYLCAGWERERFARGKLYLLAPLVS